MSGMVALVLAGGGGEALSVLTAERAVAAVPFGGKYRIIDFVLSNCCHSGVTRLGILTQHAPTSLNDHIGAGRPWDLDRREGGVVLLQPYVTRERAGWYRGTADALVQNWPMVRELHPGHVLVLAGDHVYRMDYRELLRFHQERGATLTLPVTRVPAREAWRFGMVTTDAGGRVRRLEEKPEQSPATLASMGIYLFDAEALDQALSSRPLDLVREVVIRMIDAGERVFAYEFTDYWEDVGSIPSYYRASMELLEPDPGLRLLDPSWPILTRDEERPPAAFGAASCVSGSLVAGGCRVEGQVEHSVLFPGVMVEAGARVREAVLFPDVTVRSRARVESAIVDKYVEIGAEARVGEKREGEGVELGDPGLTLLGKEVAVPAGIRIGRGCVVGVRAGPDQLCNDLPDGSRVSGPAV